VKTHETRGLASPDAGVGRAHARTEGRFHLAHTRVWFVSFDAEESGLRGSRAFVARHLTLRDTLDALKPEAIAAMLEVLWTHALRNTCASHPGCRYWVQRSPNMKPSLFTTVPFVLLLLVAPTTGCRVFMDIPDAPVEDTCNLDGVRDPGETCDGTDVGDASCESEGFYGGALGCTDGCELDVSGCAGFCGDNARQETHETCDGTDFGGASCQSLGFTDGTLACTDACALDTLGCTGEQPPCGDAVVVAPEICDGANLGTETCETQGYYGGALACAADCLSFELTDCQAAGQCGDDVRQVEQGEACDGVELSGHTCASFGCRSGTVACAADCLSFDLSGCQAGHDEDGDTVDDNCDNCPSVSNYQQRDTDGDGLGDACEVPGNAGGLSALAVFDPFVTDLGIYSSLNGTWSYGVDEVRGSYDLGGEHLHPMSFYMVNYGVEATFSLDVAEQSGENYSGVIFAWKGTLGAIYKGYACLFARDANQILTLEFISNTWNLRAQSNIAGTGPVDQWRRVYTFISGATIRCGYEDETGMTAATTWTKNLPDDDEFEGPSGPRVYRETAHFHSFVLYQ